ncbi:MAG TPA: hypothetical protein VFU04_08615 [Solirubrobacterales bacterium]|nr:hypothetical protein [Solirubrobacterales bacterium]
MALAAAAIAVLLALRLAGLGFEGDPLAVVRDAAPDDRLWDVAGRRGPVVGVAWLVWLGVFAVAFLGDRERAGRLAAKLLALSLAYLPLVLLVGAALEPGVGQERLLVAAGCPALAAVTVASFGPAALGRPRKAGRWLDGGIGRAEPRGDVKRGRGYRALAVACAASVLASAADLVAGSPLIQLSLAGPNPAAGHRYYGIGNELEALLVVLVLVGTGAALTGWAGPHRRLTTPEGGRSPMRDARTEAPPAGPAVFVVVAVVFAFVFAYGRYGADVGAAIVLPLGGAIAAALLAGRRDLALWALAVPIPALLLLAAADLLSGSDAHLTKTVLQANGGGDVLGVVGRRLREAGESFGRPLLLAGLPLVLLSAALVWLRRDRVAAWLRGVPAMRAGMAGALAATAAGTIANDSGALLLELGGLYLLAFLGFAWAESGGRTIDYP